MEFSKAKKYEIQSVDLENKKLNLVDTENKNLGVSIDFNIKLSGTVNGISKIVTTTLPITNYVIFRFINPYLDAQSDIFRIKEKDDGNSIGYIFPANALIDDQEDDPTDFNEYKQAYKFYCLKYLIEDFDGKQIGREGVISTSSFIDSTASYLILDRTLFRKKFVCIDECLPILAKYGYYHFPYTSKAKILTYISDEKHREDLKNVLLSRYHIYRGNQNITLHRCNSILQESAVTKMLYNNLLVEGDNPLYRFLVIYQIIEFLIDREFKKGLEEIIEIKGKITNYKFITKINELYSPRTTIKKLFQKVDFNDKNQIEALFRNFLLSFIPDYDKTDIGDCFYDIRNLLFHDYKTVLEKNPDSSLISIVIYCELLIHHLIISLD